MIIIILGNREAFTNSQRVLDIEYTRRKSIKICFLFFISCLKQINVLCMVFFSDLRTPEILRVLLIVISFNLYL